MREQKYYSLQKKMYAAIDEFQKNDVNKSPGYRKLFPFLIPDCSR